MLSFEELLAEATHDHDARDLEEAEGGEPPSTEVQPSRSKPVLKSLLEKDDTKKVRKVIDRAKLNAERVLSLQGLPALRSSSKHLNLDGSPIANLEKLNRLYQLWGAQLFPKLAYSDFLNGVEKVCHEKRVQMYLRQIIQDETRARFGIIDDEFEMDRNGTSSTSTFVHSMFKEQDSLELDESEVKMESMESSMKSMEPKKVKSMDNDEDEELPMAKPRGIFKNSIESDDEDYFAVQ